METAAYVYSPDGDDSSEKGARGLWNWIRPKEVKEQTKPPKPAANNSSTANGPKPAISPDLKISNSKALDYDILTLSILPTVEVANPRSPVCTCGGVEIIYKK